MSGVPVACVAINGAKNAGILAAQILALSDTELASELEAFKSELARSVEEKDGRLVAETGAREPARELTREGK